MYVVFPTKLKRLNRNNRNSIIVRWYMKFLVYTDIVKQNVFFYGIAPAGLNGITTML